MKACDFIVRYLALQAGMKHVFTYAGGTNAMLLDAVVRDGHMRPIPMRHEENVALAADGYARVRRGLSLALAMSGPGATNMMTGIAQSFFDSSPVFYLTGNVTTSTYKYDRPLRQLGFQETDIIRIAESVTKRSAFVDRVEMVPQVLRSLVREAQDGRPGPVLYDIPFDVQKQEVADAFLDAAPILSRQPRLTDEDFAAFTKLLEQSSRPVLLLGGGVQGAGAAKAVGDFARRFNLPVVVSLLGKDAFPNDDPLYVGFIGAYGNRHANIALARADLVIALGSRIDSRQTARTDAFMAGKRIIHVDIDPDVLGSTVPTALPINMDLGVFLADLETRLDEAAPAWRTPTAWSKALDDLRRLLKGDCEDGPAAFNPKRFLRRLTQAMPPGTIYTGDVGNNMMWLAQYSEVKQGDRMLFSGGLGTMGYAIPAGIGAHFAAPEANLVAIMGDGGFQMALPELSTVQTFKIPLKMIVSNNTILGLMKNFQDENYRGRYPATVEGYSVPDISALARAYSIPYRALDRDDDVEQALAWLLEQSGPALLELKVDPEWGPQPKVPPGKGLDQQYPDLPADVQASIEDILS